jgi:hypothetical protein
VNNKSGDNMAQTKIDEKQRKAVHANLKENPYKNAAMAMSRAVSDDGIVENLKSMRQAKLKAGEAPPEPKEPQERLTHPNQFDKGRDATAPNVGDGADRTEQYDDGGGDKAFDHHKKHTGASLKEVTKIGGAQETANVQESRPESDLEDNVPSAHAERISRYFNPPRAKKRTIDVGSKSDFKDGHARSMNKSRSKE